MGHEASNAGSGAGSSELIFNCLSKVGDAVGDLTPLVYRRFFARYPEAEQHFGADGADILQGKMLAGILMMILDQSEGRHYPYKIRGLVQDHQAYSTSLPMFVSMFECIREVVQEAMGSDWNDEIAEAWQAQTAGLMELVKAAHQNT